MDNDLSVLGLNGHTHIFLGRFVSIVCNKMYIIPDSSNLGVSYQQLEPNQ